MSENQENKFEVPTTEIKNGDHVIIVRQWLPEFEEDKIREVYETKLSEIKATAINEADMDGKKMTNMKHRTEQTYSLGVIKASMRAAMAEAMKLFVVSVDGNEKNVEKSYAYLPPAARTEVRNKIQAEVDRILGNEVDPETEKND